jgi:hypothetical protein
MQRQSSGGVMPQKNSGENSVLPKKYDLLDMQNLWVLSPGSLAPVNLEDCSNEEFFQFIEQYVQLIGDDLDSWSLEERCEVLNFAIEQGQAPNFLPNISA